MAIARRVLGVATGEELVALATTALATGLDSPSLRILAGLTAPTADDAMP